MAWDVAALPQGISKSSDFVWIVGWVSVWMWGSLLNRVCTKRNKLEREARQMLLSVGSVGGELKNITTNP